jgi:hypothetical protein
MKPDKIALPGSVAVIGLVYTVAMATAPETGLSAQANPTQTDRIADVEPHPGLVVAGASASLPNRTLATGPGGSVAQPQCANAIRACPFTASAEIPCSQLMQVHHRLPVGRSDTPSIAGPAWGNDKLTVF